MLPWMIAAVCAVGFIWIWFSEAYRELKTKKTHLDNELRQLEFVCQQVEHLRGSTNEAEALKRLEFEQALYCRAQENYDKTRHKSANRLPAMVFGFSPPESVVDITWRKENGHIS